MKIKLTALASAVMLFGISTAANASLVTFQSFSGNVAMSSDGFGDSDGTGMISASAPSGSTVVAAYLYTATQNTGIVPTDVDLNGVSVTYDASFPNATACCTLSSHRADVTSIVAPVINGGGGGVYAVHYSSRILDSSLLVRRYLFGTLRQRSIGSLVTTTCLC